MDEFPILIFNQNSDHLVEKVDKGHEIVVYRDGQALFSIQKKEATLKLHKDCCAQSGGMSATFEYFYQVSILPGTPISLRFPNEGQEEFSIGRILIAKGA